MRVHITEFTILFRMHIMRNPNTALQRYRAGYLKPGQPSSPWIRVATLSSVRLPALASSSTYRYKQAEVDNANIKCFDQWSRRSENPATPRTVSVRVWCIKLKLYEYLPGSDPHPLKNSCARHCPSFLPNISVKTNPDPVLFFTLPDILNYFFTTTAELLKMVDWKEQNLSLMPNGAILNICIP